MNQYMLSEAKLIKKLNAEVCDIVRKYKGAFFTKLGNNCLDNLDKAMAINSGLEQVAFDIAREE